MKFSLWLIFLCMIEAAFGQAAYTGYFIAANGGSDSNPGTISQPFATFAHAQSVMEGSSTKTLYIRAGTYSNTAIYLTSADNNETWSYYPPDGYDTAILDGGSSSSTTGGNPITIDGASNFTFNGFTIHNVQRYGIAIHGGAFEDSTYFPNTVPNVTGDVIENNIINTSYPPAYFESVPFGGILQMGQVSNTAITNNVIENVYASCISAASYGNNPSPNSGNTYPGLVITGNVCLNSNISAGDSGGIYLLDRMGLTIGAIIENNFIRDYQNGARWNSRAPRRDVAIYLDQGVNGATVSGNVIG